MSPFTRRDLYSPCDCIRILIDSYHDRWTACELAVTPSGFKSDRSWFNDHNSDDRWDAVWDVSIPRDQQGWTAEFRMLFSQMRFKPSGASTFGVAAFRDFNPEFIIRPFAALMLTTGRRLGTDLADTQWVGEVSDTFNHNVFSRLDQTTVALTGRLNDRLTPNLSIQWDTQPFISAGAHSGFKEVANAHSTDYNARFAPSAYDASLNGDPDFNDALRRVAAGAGEPR